MSWNPGPHPPAPHGQWAPQPPPAHGAPTEGTMHFGGRAVARTDAGIGAAFALWRETLPFSLKQLGLGAALVVGFVVNLALVGAVVTVLRQFVDQPAFWMIPAGVLSLPMIGLLWFIPGWMVRSSAAHGLVVAELVVRGGLPEEARGDMVAYAERRVVATYGDMAFLTETFSGIHNLYGQITNLIGGFLGMVASSKVRIALRGHLQRISGNVAFVSIGYVALDGIPEHVDEDTKHAAVERSVRRCLAQYVAHRGTLLGGLNSAALMEGAILWVAWFVWFFGSFVVFYAISFFLFGASMQSSVGDGGNATAQAVAGYLAIFLSFIAALVPAILTAMALNVPLRQFVVRPVLWIRELLRFHQTIAGPPLDPGVVAQVAQGEDYASTLRSLRRHYGL